jgi:hypothetical protein
MPETTVLHAADLHLDGPVAVLGEDAAQPAAGARRESLRRLVDLAAQNQARVVILAGDVFHTPQPPLSAVLSLEDALGAWLQQGARVFIAPGNHDPYSPDSVWSSWRPPAGVTVFGPEASGEALTESGLWVAGVGHPNAEESRDLSPLLPAPPDGLTGLAVLHCTLTGDETRHEPYAPTRLETLTARPFRVWALGHRHLPEQKSVSPLVIYAGTPQGAHLAEPGPRGAWLIRVGGAGAEAEFHDLAPLGFEDLALSGLAGVDTLDGLAGLARAAMLGAGPGPERRVCARLRLSGPSPLWGVVGQAGEEEFSRLLAQRLGLLSLVLEMDGLCPARDLAQLSTRDDVLGRLLGLIQQAEDDPELLDQLAADLATGLHPLNRRLKGDDLRDYLAGLLEHLRSQALRDFLPGGSQ